MTDDLISGFSPETFSEWCREKFTRFTADPHEAHYSGDFPKARVVGYVQSLPDGDINRPLLVMSVYAGEQLSERSSRRRQFDFARNQLLAAIDKPPAKVKGLFTQGLFAFHDTAGNFRLSLVSGRADGKRLVYGTERQKGFSGDTIWSFESTDLVHWSRRKLLQNPGWRYFNTSLTKGPDGYVLLMESDAPKYASRKFTMFFATSKDLKEWECGRYNPLVIYSQEDRQVSPTASEISPEGGDEMRVVYDSGAVQVVRDVSDRPESRRLAGTLAPPSPTDRHALGGECPHEPLRHM